MTTSFSSDPLTRNEGSRGVGGSAQNLYGTARALSADDAQPKDRQESLLSRQQAATKTEESKPRAVVLTVVDDWGYSDVEYHDTTMHTPELMSLAASGIILEQFYTACTCTPSRAMLMTGRYNIRNGMQDSVVHATEPRGVPLDERFLAQKLREAGYATAGVGKWHLGMVRTAYLPERRGFDRWYGIYTGGGSHTAHLSVSQPFAVRGNFSSGEAKVWQGYNLWENLEPSADSHGSTHSTELYTRKAVEYITEFAHTPNVDWFLYLSYQAVHDPIVVGDERYVRETSCANATQVGDPGVAVDARPTLCGMVAEVDDGLKSVRLAIGDDWDRTIMIVLSDNGGVKSHGSSNWPLRGEKGTYYEGGVRVPAFLTGGYVAAALARAGTKPYVSTTLAHVVDIHATLLDVAAYKGSELDKSLDGVSLWPHLIAAAVDGPPPPRSEILINLNSDLFGGSGALRSGSFKLMVNPEAKEAAIYSKVRNALSTYSATVTADAFDKIVAEVHSQVLGQPRFYLFDLENNPTERDDGKCDNPANCFNLYDNPDYRDVVDRLQDAWRRYQSEAAPSSFAWEDDGPLADPSLFVGFWGPWRDNDNVPLASYLGTTAIALNQDKAATYLQQPNTSAVSDTKPDTLVHIARQYSLVDTFTALQDNAQSAPSAVHTLIFGVALLSFCVGAFVWAKFFRPASPWRTIP